MKICLFTENYYRGLDTFLINLINAWPDSNDELTIVCNGTHPGLNSIEKNATRQLNIERYFRLFTSNLAQGQNTWGRYFFVRAFFVILFKMTQYPIILPWYIFTLINYFRKSKFDRLMVVNGGYPASLLCRSAVIAWRLAGKRPLAVLNFHNSTTKEPWYTLIFENSIDRLVIRSVSHIVSVSKSCLDSLGSRDEFIDCTKLSFIHNGIKDPLINKKSTVIEKNSPQYCLMLATYETRKGHSFLLHAFKLFIKDFPNVLLHIYGHGKPHEIQRVADEVKKMDLEPNVKLHGFVSDTSELIAGASILLVPSQAYESFGLTIIEAMALSTPVIATDVGGMPEILAGSNAGYVCSREDPFEFAAAMKQIIGDTSLAHNLGQNGRKFFEQKFRASTMANQYRLLLD